MSTDSEPEFVKNTCSSPTAVVNTRLMITRGQPVRGEPGEIDLEGELEMCDGVAAFEGFPYEFQNISGRFRFTESSLEFLNITGRSASGAELTAHGRISPLTDDAEVNVAVDVRNAPIDAAMEASFGEGRGEMIPALFSTRRYEELRAAGLIQTPAEAEQAATRLGALVDRQNSGDASPELVAEIDDARRSAAIPAFEFRGSADVSVRVHRPLGDEVDWQTDVEIRLPKVGLLPDKFPLPIAATNILARVHDRDGALVSGDFRGLTGGRADVHATFNIPFADDLEQEVRPDITIQAAGIPLDPVLIHALPGENRGPDEGPGSESAVKRILHALNISGEGDGRVRIATGGDGELGFEADFTLRDSQALPDGSDVSLGNVFGRVRASESSVNVELAAQARRRDVDQWRAISGPMQVRIDARIPPAAAHAPATYNADLDIPSLDIASPVEPLLSIFSPAAAQKIADLRAAHNPSGEVDLEAMIIADGGDHTRVNVEARGARPVSFDAMNGRFAFTPSSGAFRLASGESTRISFDQLMGDLRYENAPAGAAELTGSLLLTAGPDENPGAVKLALADAPIESPLVAGIVAERLGQAELWERHLPRGRYEADLLISRSADESLQFRGTVEPRTLTVRASESDLTFTGVHGTIDFGPGAGALRQLSLETPDWAASASASWNTQSAGGFIVQSDLGLQGTRATDELFALLPQDLTGILRGIQLKLDGPFQLRGGALNMARGEAPFTRFAGVLETESASLDAGIVVENLAGSSAISFSKEGEAAPVFEIVTAADRFQAAGLAMTHGRARIVSTDLPGEVSIPEASARIHGGRIAATARIVPTSSEASAPAAPPAKAFTASVNASGLRFASILKDLESQLPLPAGIDQADDRSRGVLEGNLALQGTIGRPESRRGRGSFQIAGGRILNVPFAMRMVELSNLQLPTNARLGYAKGHFFLDGNRITFEDLGLFSSAVQILGSGSMHWPDKSLDLRFDTKPARGIPILSGLIRGIRDELVTTSVKGTLAKPDISLRQFPGPRRMLDRAVGIGSDEPPVDSPEPTAEAQGRLMHEGIRPRANDRRPTRWAPDTQ